MATSDDIRSRRSSMRPSPSRTSSRWPFAVPGFLLGALVIVLNLIPFPVPPAQAAG